MKKESLIPIEKQGTVLYFQLCKISQQAQLIIAGITYGLLGVIGDEIINPSRKRNKQKEKLMLVRSIPLSKRINNRKLAALI